MAFQTFTYFVFLLGMVVGYYALPTRLRWVLLLAGSYFFYMCWNARYALLLLLSTAVTYAAALLIDRANGIEDGRARVRRKKAYVALSLVCNLGILFFFKYWNMIAATLDGALELAGLSARAPRLQVLLPVGISFYIFQALGYTVDVYRGDVRATRHFGKYALFVSFFPQLVAGPIERSSRLLHQFDEIHRPNFETMRQGAFQILLGLIKKVLVADRLAVLVDMVYRQAGEYGAPAYIVATVCFAFQIYCDFSGYSDMAIGIALLLGFRFNVNFDSPYQSATITEFWRRWHISLSSWLKDYLYISLGGNRKGKIRTYINLLITMLLGGLWHGASVSFILWGALHGVALAVHKFVMNHFSSFKPLGSEMKPWRRVIGVLITFHLVCFGWILFRADSMQTVGEVLTQIFTNFHPEVFMQFVVGYKGVFVLMVVGYILHFMPKSAENGLQAVVTRSPLLVQAVMLAIAIFVVVQFKSAGVQPFIYFQF